MTAGSGWTWKSERKVAKKKSMTRIGNAEVHHSSSSVHGRSSSGTWGIAGLDLDELGTTLTVTDKLSNQANENGRFIFLKRVFTLEELEEDPSLLLDLNERNVGYRETSSTRFYAMQESSFSSFSPQPPRGFPHRSTCSFVSAARAGGHHGRQVP